MPAGRRWSTAGRPTARARSIHVSLTIKGWDECLERVKKLGYDWRAAIVPGTTLWQIFVHDPSGVMMGADLRRQGRGGGLCRRFPADRVYQAGKPFRVYQGQGGIRHCFNRSGASLPASW